MILVDTSVWVDHLRRGDVALQQALEHGEVLTHPWVLGELALGGVTVRGPAFALLSKLPAAATATTGEVLILIEQRELAGRGIGYVDAHLLASALVTPGATLWTRDRRLRDAAAELSVAAPRR